MYSAWNIDSSLSLVYLLQELNNLISISTIKTDLK